MADAARGAERILEGLNPPQAAAVTHETGPLLIIAGVDTLVPYGYADVQISTFHAFGDRLIKENALELGLTPDFRVLTRAEQVIFLRDHLFEFPLKHYRPLGDPTRHLQAILGQISRLKDEDVG